jgi:putative sigma-54 modulation protein
MNASDHLKKTIESKLGRLGKYFSDEINANVTLTMEKGRQKVEATINAKGTIFRAEETANDVYNAVDRIVEKLSSQMSRFKTKLIRKHKDTKELILEDLPGAADEELEEMRVVRRKLFNLIPMTPDEALVQMELLEHTFYVFLNVESDTVSVVYKRKDKDYGLLETRY